MTAHVILWRRLDVPGHESARLAPDGAGWRLAGTAVFLYEHRPCRLDYAITCDQAWRTTGATVAGWVGDQIIDVRLEVDAGARWRLNGEACPAVTGCIDVDLNFSPSTNVLPIRRLQPAVGQAVDVRAAWLRFPSFALEPLPQVYRRVDDRTYRYESHGVEFVATLAVDAAGMVLRYPEFCEALT